MQNSSVLNFDARLNSGFTEKLKKQMAIVLLKNIEKMRARGLDVKKDFLVPEIYSY